MKWLRNIHLSPLFFLISGLGIACIAGSYYFPFLEFVGVVVLLLNLTCVLIDVLFIRLVQSAIEVHRFCLERMNLNDKNEVTFSVYNGSNLPLHLTIYEGFPVFMQRRSFHWNSLVLAKSEKLFTYQLIPKERGEISFTPIVVFIRSILHLAEFRKEFVLDTKVHVYPSVLQMKQYELKVFNKQTLSTGVKRIRRLGNTSEFEQIRNYIQGDDLRTVNWKATSRRNELMVNQFQDEKSQPFYCLIDKSRAMQLSFDGMTVLDYAINSSLVLSNIALRKGDKAGLLTFSNKIGDFIPAERKEGQLRRILDVLYRQKTTFQESDYELLYQQIRNTIKTRSMILLYTNFESVYSMRRVLPILQRINKSHVLVVAFFQNNELQDLTLQPANSYKEIVESSVADYLNLSKWKIAIELTKNGIQTIYTKPEDLSIHSINKYLELKARGKI
ncbi:MAG TPA: DUF58 domain-containing protein [Fluviicola sp.]|nr:DUF58 domain-containing protein [Fluviicola sp.]